MDGNKLRDALRKARVFISCSPLKRVEGDFGCIDRDEICAEIGSILAAPVKNCEVGTAMEQTARFAEFCKSHIHSDLPKCAGCPLEDIPDRTGCAQAWGQMPYESEAAK